MNMSLTSYNPTEQSSDELKVGKFNIFIYYYFFLLIWFTKLDMTVCIQSIESVELSKCQGCTHHEQLLFMLFM